MFIKNKEPLYVFWNEVICIFQRLLATFLSALVIFLFIGFYDFNLLDDLTDHLKNKEEYVHDSSGKGELSSNEALITKVIDGDTIIVVNADGEEERVRLLLIDTPETVHPDKPAQPYGQEASAFAKDYLKQGKKVVIEKGEPEKDIYGRTLAYLFVDGVNFNQLMLEKGYARIAYVNDTNAKYLDEFRTAEQRAREKKLNIWSIPGYVTNKGFDPSVVN